MRDWFSLFFYFRDFVMESKRNTLAIRQKQNNNHVAHEVNGRTHKIGRQEHKCNNTADYGMDDSSPSSFFYMQRKKNDKHARKQDRRKHERKQKQKNRKA